MNVLKFYAKFFAVCFALFLIQGNIQAQDRQKIQYSDSWSKKGLTILSQKSNGLEFVYSVNEFNISDMDVKGQIMKNIELPGVFLPNDEGAPNLPGFGRFVAIPQGADAELKILEVRKEVIKNIEVAPAPDIPLTTNDDPLEYNMDMDIYQKDGLYPRNPVKISGKSEVRGVDVVTLGITPFQYNPVKKELIVLKDIKFEINFNGGNGHFGEDRLRSRWFDPILKNNVINGNSLPKMDYSQYNTKDEGAEYLIIVPDDPDFIAWADTIKQFRTLQGILTKVVTISEIGGNDVTTIDNYIGNAYTTWDPVPAAVLIMADYGTSGNGITSPSLSHPYSGSFISDNSYADRTGNHLPDIIFARMTAQDATQLETMVHKFMHHELNPPTNPDYYNNPITALGWQTERWFQICSETVGGFWHNELGKNQVRINAIYSGNPSSTWSTATNTSQVMNYFGSPGLHYLPDTPDSLGGWSGGTANDVVNAINSGSFMLQHRDHGGETGWGEPAFGNSNINSLTNTDLTFVMSINCLTGMFDYSGECFAEKFHRYTYNNQPSGALGVIAATDVSYSFVNDTYVWGMYDYMWPNYMPDYGDSTWGVSSKAGDVQPAFANANGKYFLYNSSWPYNTGDKQVTYNLFHMHGDAFTTVYSEMPQDLVVQHDAALLSGLTQFNVKADQDALIALTANGEIIGTAYGTGDYTTIDIESQLPGDNVTITVTKQNFYRYSTSIPVIPPAGAYVVNDSIAINDDAGNMNGQFDYGETIYLSMAAKNVGLEDATNVTVNIDSDDPRVTILDGTEDFGNISAENIEFIEDAFQLSVCDTVPDNHNISFSVEATDGDSVWMSYFSIKAYAPVISIGNMEIANDDNANGRLDPGETADFIVNTYNIGHAESGIPVATLCAYSPYITIDPESQELTQIPAMDTTEVTFTVTAHDSITNGTLFNVEYTFADLYTDTANYELVVGQPPEMIIGDGTSSSAQYPFYTYYENNRTQMLYLGSELLAGEKLVQEIAFDFSAIGAIPVLTDLYINFKKTSIDQIGNSFEDMSDATNVFYSDAYTMPTQTGWHVFDVDDYTFNGTDTNLIVEVIWGDNGNWDDEFVVNCTDMPVDMVAYGYSDTETPPNYDGNTATRPNLQIFFAGDEPDTSYVVTFTVLDSATNDPLNEASVKIGSLNKAVDNNGQTSFELMPADYFYTAQGEMHNPKTGSFTVDDEEEITVLLVSNESVGEINMGSFSLYPNPANNMVTIESGSIINQVEIYNITGKLILNKTGIKDTKTSISLDKMNTGLYLVNIYTPEGIHTHKIQVIK